MVQVWYAAAAAAVPAIFLLRISGLLDRRKRGEKRRGREAKGGPKDPNDFVCERVCTSKRMLSRVGTFSKDPTPNTCVTVCGVSTLDACTEACRRSVCVNPHHVPNWNDVCMRRCQEECARER